MDGKPQRVRLNVSLPIDVWAALTRLAKEAGKTKEQIVEDLVREWVLAEDQKERQ